MSEPEIAELPNQDWKKRAACIGMPSELFYPENSTIVPKRAKDICWNECPVREECLQFAIEAGEQHGLWGGVSPRDRRPMRAQYIKSLTLAKERA